MSANTRADAVAKLLFLIFVYGASSGGRIAATEIERLQSLLADCDGTPNPSLRAGLERLRSKYPSWWAKYRAKKLVITADAIRLRLAAVCIDMDREQAAGFREAVRQFLRYLIPQEPTLFGLPQTAPLPDQVGTRVEIDRLLQATHTSMARRKLSATRPASNAATPIEPVEKGKPVAPAPRVDPSPPRPQADAPLPAPSPEQSPASSPSMAASAREVWTGGRTKVVCMRVVDETHDAKTYTFAAVPPRLFRYRPGQYVTLECKADGKAVRRSVALSSSPSRPYTLSVTIKRSPDDAVSGLLHERLREGGELFLSGPHGQFSCVDHPASKLLMCAAGSGIAPMISMLRWLADTASPVDALVIYNVRTQADIIFEQELKQLSVQFGRSMRLSIVPASLAPGMPWNGPMGRMNESMLGLLAPDVAQREVFASGPAGYMQTVRALLEKMQFSMDHFHQESFADAASVPAPAVADKQTAAVSPETRIVPSKVVERAASGKSIIALWHDRYDEQEATLMAEADVSPLSIADIQAGYVQARIRRAADRMLN